MKTKQPVREKLRRLLATILCLAMALSVLTACGTPAADQSADTSGDMTRELGGEIDENALRVPFSREGTYTVSFKESDLLTESEAEEMDRAAVEEESAADASAPAAEEPAADASAPAAEEPAADASAPAAEEPAADASAPAEEEPAADASAPAAEPVAFGDLTQEDVQVMYSFIIQEKKTEKDDKKAKDSKEGEPVEPKTETRNAEITSFENKGGTITISFTDKDAAENLTGAYGIMVEKMQAGVPVAVEFEDHTLTADTESIPSDSEATELNLTVAEGAFAEGITADNITLDGSFAKMKVDSVKAEENNLNLQLSGAPYYDPKVNNGYTAGVITVASEGFQEGGTDHSAYIDVVLPSAGVDSADLKVGNGTATVPLELTGMDASAITAEDVQFESGAEVTGVKADGENRVLVTVKTDNAEDLTGQITVGEQSYLTGVTHAGFYPTFVSIDKDGENFNITLDLDIRSGTVSDQISPDMVTLSEEFEGGKVTSLTKTDDTAAELVISVPAGDQTDSDFDLTGTVTLAEGALNEEWGEAAPACDYTRRYTPEEMGRIDADTVIEYTIKGLGFVDEDAQTVAEYGKGFYDMFKSFAKGDIDGVINNIKAIFQMAGIFEEEAPKETQTDRIEKKLDKLQLLMDEMNKKLDTNLRESYKIRMGPFDNAMLDLESDCDRARIMLKKAEALCPEKNIAVPGENASNEELMEFNAQLIKLMEDEEKAGNGNFKNFSRLLEDIEKNFKIATDELQKTGDTNILCAYDSFWNMFFNFENQGYYLRTAYRTNACFQVKQAYDMLAIYYQIPKYADTYGDLTKRLGKAIQGINSHPAGNAPVQGNREIYSPSLHRTVIYSKIYCDLNEEVIWDQWIADYRSRLHGWSMKEDLALAGLVPEPHWRGVTINETWGIGFRGVHINTSWDFWPISHHIGCVTLILRWDNKTLQTEKTYDTDPDDPLHNNMVYFVELTDHYR